MERSVVSRISGVHLESEANQRLDRSGAALVVTWLGGPMQECPPLGIPCLGIGARMDQGLGARESASSHCVVERGETFLVPQVDVGAVLDQESDDPRIAC